MENWDEIAFDTSFISAGDIIITAIKGANSSNIYFNGTFEVEF